MSKSVHSVKLIPYDSVDLDRLSYTSGDLVYDATNGTIRLMDGVTQGGTKIASQTYVTNSLAAYATNTSVNTAISLALTGYATTASLSAYATTASLSAYATTASLSTYATTASLSTAAVNSAGKLTTARNINGVSFDGSANITVSTLVNGAKTITLNSSGNLVIPGASGGGLISSTGYNYLSTIGSLIIDGDQVALDYRGNNNLFVDEFGIEFYTNTTGTAGHNAGLPSDNYWAFAPDGTSTFPGNITTPNSVSADTVTTTNDVTVGGNAVISNKPTLTTHATNKQYVDKKATAMAIALS